jgi:DNA-binding LacI/PurR family transcriptional regulator
MDQLGYVPNVAARSLKGGRNGLIGVHTFEPVFPVASSDYYREFLNGIEEQAVQEGLDLVLFASTQRADGSRSIYGSGANRLRLADGAIMLGFKKDDDELARLAAEGYPFVFIGHRVVPGVDIPHVTADYRGGMRPVADMLAGFGHEHVAYLGITVRGPSQLERLAGIRESFLAVGIAPPSETFADAGDIDEAWVRRRLDEGVTAILAESFELARALGAVIRRMPLRVPEDVSIICLDTDPVSELNDPVSHVSIPRRAMGRLAVTMLNRLIDGTLGTDRVAVLDCGAPSDVSVGRPRAVPDLVAAPARSSRGA